jgi:hypothetical protein
MQLGGTDRAAVTKLIDLEYIFSLGSSAPHSPVMSIYVRLALVNLVWIRVVYRLPPDNNLQ